MIAKPMSTHLSHALLALSIALATTLATMESVEAAPLDAFLNDCTLKTFPGSSASSGLAPGTIVQLTASCASGVAPILYTWDDGSVGDALKVAPLATKTYTVKSANPAGQGPKVSMTVYVEQPKPPLTLPPSGCSIVQLPDTRFDAPSPGSPISLQVLCSKGNAPTGCTWDDPAAGTSCRFNVAAPDQSKSIAATAFNSYGSADAATSVIHAAGSSPLQNSSGKVIVARRNTTLNGAAISTQPRFVSEGDVLKFDVMLLSIGTDKATGLGLCLHYSSAISAPTAANTFMTDLIGSGASGLDCSTRGLSPPVFGTDVTFITAWASFAGTWPNMPLPLKLYEAQIKIAATPTGSSQLGFGANSLPGRTTFVSDTPLILCGKPKVYVAKAALVPDGTAQVAYNVSLSNPVASLCSDEATFPVVLQLVDPPGNAVTHVSGPFASLEGRSLTIRFPVDGVTTVAPITITMAQASATGFDDSIVRLIPNVTYSDGGVGRAATSTTASVAITVTGGIIDFSAGPPSPVLRVARGGRANGAVKSDDGSIDCTTICERSYFYGSKVVLTAVPAPGSQFAGWIGECTGRGPCTINMSRSQSASAMFAPGTTPLNIDVDGDGRYDALSDGLLISRYLLGLTGTNLTSGVAAESAGAALLDRLVDIWPTLDIDGNGAPDALTDGILLQRYLFGLRGAQLLPNAIGAGAKRITGADIEAYIRTLLP